MGFRLWLVLSLMGYWERGRDGPRRPKLSKIAVFSRQRGNCRLLGLLMRPMELAIGPRFESRGYLSFALSSTTWLKLLASARLIHTTTQPQKLYVDCLRPRGVSEASAAKIGRVTAGSELPPGRAIK